MTDQAPVKADTPKPATQAFTIGEAALKFMPPALIVASDPAARQGLGWLAQQYQAGGMLPEGLSAQGAIILMVAGIDYKLSPIEAVSKLYLIGGRVTPSAHEMQAQVIRGGVQVEIKEATTESATVILSRANHPSFEFTYTKADAVKAGLWGKRGPWTNDPRSMLLARAKSQAFRAYCPDLLSSMYTAEEAANGVGDVDEGGNFLPDPTITGDQPERPVKAFEAQPAPVVTQERKAAAPEPEPVAAPVAEDGPPWEDAAAPVAEAAPAPAAKPKPTPKPRTAPAAKKEATVLPTHAEAGIAVTDVREEGGKQGGDFNRDATIKDIAARMIAHFGRDDGGARLRARVQEVGRATSADLTDLEVIALVAWTSEAIEADKRAKAEAAATPEIPAFDPRRGAGTRSKTAPVQDATAANWDEQILELFHAFAQAEQDEIFNDVIDEFGYDSDKSSEQVKRKTLEALKAKHAELDLSQAAD